MSEPHISQNIPTSAHAIRQIQQREMREEIQVVESEASIDEYMDSATFNPAVRSQKFHDLPKLKSQARESESKEEVEGPDDAQITDIAEIAGVASRFREKNEELNPRTLLILRSRITADDTPDEALEKVLATYPDAALADEALDFLIETAEPNILPLVKLAKEKLNSQRSREITAGRNIMAEAQKCSKEGLGPSTTLRGLYYDITGTQREPIQLFAELTEKFSHNQLRPAINFLLHSLGSDLKSKGSSIPHAELKRLIDETRSLQGILGVFRFFQSRMGLVSRQFASYQLTMPSRLSFENLAKLFIKILAERYMNPEKILQTARVLGLSEEVAAQIIVYTQMRDAIKQVAPRYYRNPQHRDELSKSFIDTIDQLEDQLEEEEEEEESQKKKKEKKEKKDS